MGHFMLPSVLPLILASLGNAADRTCCRGIVVVAVSRFWRVGHCDLEVDDRGAVDRLECVDAYGGWAFECGDGDSVDADRVWTVG